MRPRVSRPDRAPHGINHVALLRESTFVFLRDAGGVDPDRELATAPLHKFGVELQIVFDGRRHTGGARAVVSNPAEADANAWHAVRIAALARATAGLCHT